MRSDQLKYRKNSGHSTGKGDRYEERTLALVFLRCLRHGLRFLLSANDAAGGGKLDDLVLSWHHEAGVRALFVQLKHRAAETALPEAGVLDVVKVYYECYKDIKDSLDGGSYALVLCTNRKLVKGKNDVVREQKKKESVHGMEFLDSGGCLYALNPDNDHVKRAFDHDDKFIQHFYLFCDQSDCEKILAKINEELQLLLGADENSCKAICRNLCDSMRTWMDTQDPANYTDYITNSWGGWLDIVDRYIKKEITTCNSIVTRIKYINVGALQEYIEDHNPTAWIRPPGRGAAVLTATKLHQILRDEKHIMVCATRVSELEKKIQCCWGPFCRWLVLVDDTEESYGILRRMVELAGPKRSLLIVSQKGDDFFEDKCKSGDIPDETWKELTKVEIKLNSEQYSCCLGDMCDTEALKTMLGENPEALAALSQLTGPVRMGQDLDPLPNNHIDRRLISRMHVREEFFSSLGDYDVCIMNKLSYNHLANVSINETVKFEELENYLCASNALCPPFGVTDNIAHHVIQMICSKYQTKCVYVLSYEDDRWKILFLHRGCAKIRPYVTEQSRSLLQIVDDLSSRIIIDGKPGIGKSTFLLDIASQVKRKNPSWWILRINLLTYSEAFNSSSSSHEAVNDILLRVVYNEKNVGILEHSLLQHCLKEYSHIICLVDGFDEICPDYAEKCLQALQQLAPRRGKLVVATRPSVTDRLEAAMGVLAHSLPAFTEEEVHRFHQRGNLMLGITSVVVELLKIPLFSRMYAESLESGIVVDDIVSLYETFFDKKFRRLYGEKWGEDLSKPGMKRIFETELKKQVNHLGFLAVSHLLPKLEIPFAAQTSSIDREELVRAGIIYQFIDDKPVFIHRTFAEHFLAKWCLSHVAKGDCAKVYQTALSDNSLEFFIDSFDRMASRGRPLLTAVLNGSESEVESLLLEGADPAERDEAGRNSLHLAAAYSRESTLLWLLVERLEVAGAERVGGSASGPAEETSEAVNEVVVYEMGEKARLADKEGTSQSEQVTSDMGLGEASGVAGRWAVEKTVAATDPVSAALGAEDALLQWTPLRYAVERRRWEAVAALLEAGAQLRHLGDFQRGLLHPQQLWRVFKEKGYNALWDHIESTNDWSDSDIQDAVSIVCAEMSPQQYKEICLEAIRHYDWEVARLLHLKIVEMQNKPTSTGSPELQLNQGTTLKPRHEAGLGISKKLEDKRTGSTEERQTAEEDYAEGWTELHRAVAAGDVAGARRLLEAGADVNMRDKRGRTAMHLAALAGCVDCVELLLSAGAAVNVQDEGGYTALHRAAELGRRQAVRLLLAAGAGVAAKDEGGVTALHWAAWSGSPECARLLLEAGAGVQEEDEDGDTPLHRAAEYGRAACVRLLLQAGADVRQRGSGGETPLHRAAWRGDAQSAKLLLDAGADSIAVDDELRTPLHCAAKKGRAESVRLLLEAGADALAQDGRGRTPLQVAAWWKREACLTLLNSAVAHRQPTTT